MSHFPSTCWKTTSANIRRSKNISLFLSMSLRYGFENKLVFHFYTLFLSIVNCLYLVRGGVEVMKKLDGDLFARPGNFHQGLELSLNSCHPLDIFNTGRSSVFLLKMFSVIFLLWNLSQYLPQVKYPSRCPTSLCNSKWYLLCSEQCWSIVAGYKQI